MTESTIPAGWILDAIANQRLESDYADGVRATIRLYYINYTDADKLEADFLAALELILFNIEPINGLDLVDVIREVEAELRSEGRKVRTFPDEEDEDDHN